MFYIYVLRCSNLSLYVGYSEDLKKRVFRHNQGMVISTKHRLPSQLIYYESFTNKRDAKSREKYLKSGGGRQQLKDILKNTILEA